MPIYEYYCRNCATKFEMLRGMSRADEPASCPDGHPGATRVLSLVANYKGGRGSDSAAPFEGTEDTAAGGGCACGGACACGGF